MSTVTIFAFVNAFFAGILAGQEIVIHYGLRAPARTLDERSQLILRKALVLRIRVLVPAFFVPAALSGIGAAVLGGAAPGVGFRQAGVLAILTWALIRVVGTVPINSATVEWDTDAPPKNWRALVDRAERFHILGVWAAILAFACSLAGIAVDMAAALMLQNSSCLRPG